MEINWESELFEISRSSDNYYEDRASAYLQSFPGSDDVNRWTRPKFIEVPEKIYFDAHFALIKELDFPSTNVRWPIMSEKMIKTLLSVDNFEHRKIPVIMLNDTVMSENRYEEDGKTLKDGIAMHGYSVVQLTEHLDIFDREKSVYEEHFLNPRHVEFVKKLVLTVTPDDLPPVFRLSVIPKALLITKKAREALEKAGIRGVDFAPLYRALV
ncbi:MAG: hypothetical protein GY754_11630 [bacterium]|nr:hypothetical protein [bacterium]